MDYVKKHWLVTVSFFSAVTVLFTFIVLKDNPVFRITDQHPHILKTEPSDEARPAQLFYNYHRADEKETEMTQFNDVPVSTEEQSPAKTFIYHKVERGDTLFKIARLYDVSIGELVRSNDIADPDLIYQGTVLKITKGLLDSVN
jgi:LysM repeat protein